jgi:hypothetical protein
MPLLIKVPQIQEMSEGTVKVWSGDVRLSCVNNQNMLYLLTGVSFLKAFVNDCIKQTSPKYFFFKTFVKLLH